MSPPGGHGSPGDGTDQVVADAASALEEAVARERNACFATSQAKSRLSRTHSTDVGQLRHVPHATAKNNNTATRAGDRNAGESERERESVCVWDNQRWCVKAMGKNCLHVYYRGAYEPCFATLIPFARRVVVELTGTNP